METTNRMPAAEGHRARHRGLGLPWLAIIALAGLAAPRVVVHDLGLVAPTGLASTALALAPPLAWLAVVLLRRVPRPFLTLLVIGVVYGVMLGAIHVILWDTAYGGAPPTLGGNLAERLPAALEAVLLRTAAAVSSVVVGAAIGAVVGAVGWLLDLVRRGVGRRA